MRLKKFIPFLNEKLNFDAAIKYLNSLSAKFKFKTLLDKNYELKDIFAKIEQNKGLGQETGLIFKAGIQGQERINFYVVCQDNGMIKRVLDDVKTNWNTFSDSPASPTGTAPKATTWGNAGTWAKESKIYEQEIPAPTPTVPVSGTTAVTTSGTTTQQQKPVGTSTFETDKTSIIVCTYNTKTGKCGREGEGITKDKAKFDQLKTTREQQGCKFFYVKWVMMW
jgi:hypothetical protein